VEATGQHAPASQMVGRHEKGPCDVPEVGKGHKRINRILHVPRAWKMSTTNFTRPAQGMATPQSVVLDPKHFGFCRAVIYRLPRLGHLRRISSP